MRIVFLSLIFLVAGCATPCRPVFIHPQGPEPSLFNQFKDALALLKQSNNEVGKLTYSSVCEGRAKLGTLKDLTAPDYQQILSDLKRYETESFLAPEHFTQLRNDESPALKELERLFDGYMWEDRIYLNRKADAKELAATLVHELNHVLNRSERHYYQRPQDAFLEEFRAFYVQAIFEGKNLEDEGTVRNLQRQIVLDYNLQIPDKDRPLKPDGLLYPDRTSWEINWKQEQK